MLFKNLLILLLIASLASCSPKINSNFTKRYPRLAETEKIIILNTTEYSKRDNREDEKLGSISVFDRGTTTNCSFDKMLQIVKDSARENGGNIIGLTKHIKPTLLGSTCHQFEADILRENKIGKNNLSEFSSGTYKNEDNFTNLKDVVAHRYLLRFNVGASFLIGKKDNSTEFLKATNDIIKTGTQFSLSGLYKINNRDGIGINYTYTYRGGTVKDVTITFNDLRPSEDGSFNLETHVNYFAFDFFSRFPLSKGKNELLLDTSIGYFIYRETAGVETVITTESGNFGFDFGFEYNRMITKQLGIGLNLGLFIGSISELTINDGLSEETFTLDSEESINLSNFNTGLHLNYSF